MKILYISTLASQKALEDAKKQDPSFSSYAVQKFTRLLNEGFAKNGNEVQALSTFFLSNVGYCYHRHKEEDNGIHFEYIPSPNLRALRIVWLLVYCFFKVLFWGIKDKKDKAVICDVLNVSACAGTILATRITNVPCVGVVTDMPGIGPGINDDNPTANTLSFAARINRWYLDKFTHYVFLTEQMNNVINTKHRPYIVMEGLVDANMTIPKKNQKEDKRIVIYAGGLNERFGLKLLVDGFIQADVEDTELWIYGNGPFVESLNTYCKNHKNIKYKGIRPNNEVVEAELKATLLVNPRPTQEEFTKYSFPSKNMEYMVSGTPVLTTMLPGMPKEYHPYVYLFDKGESTEGYAEVLHHVLTLPDEELHEKGMKARTWVLENKNNIKQAHRIIEIL